jgi:hypothetical protein
LAVGLSFMTAGGLTNSLVSEKVLDPISNIQNNLGDHLAAEVAHSAAKLAAMFPGEQARTRPKAPENSSTIGTLREALDPNWISPARDSSPFRCLLGPSRYQGLGEITTTPAVFLNADSPEGLQKQLPQAHRRFPYVRAVLTTGPGMEGLQSQLLSVVRGTSLPNGTTGPVHIRGHVAASCTPALLAQSAAAGEESLPANLIWLVDGHGEVMLPKLEDPDSLTPFKMQARYRESMERAWAYRLDYRNEAKTVQVKWQPMQRQWVTFLQRMEPRCPGVTQAARSLAATLLFGCGELHEPGKSCQWSAAGVIKLAVFIVERMVRRRERLWLAEQDARILELAVKLVEKLQDGPLDARGLTRKTSRLLIGDCRQVLELFDRLGIASRVGDDKWKLALPVRKAVDRLNTPYIDV